MIKNIVIVLIITLTILFIYGIFQESLKVNGGKGYDGVHYYEITEQIANKEKISSYAPFIYRIGTPFLVSKFFDDYIFGFKTINLVFSVILSIIIYLLASIYLENKLAILTTIFYQLHWISGVRYILFDPMGTDYIALTLIYLSIYMILRKINNYTLWVILISSIGVFFREIALIPIIILIFNRLKEKNFKWSYKDLKNAHLEFLLVIPVIIYVIINLSEVFNIFLTKTNDYNSITSAVRWIYVKGIGQFIHSFYNVFGLLLIIPIVFYFKLKEYKNQFELLYLTLVIITFLSLIGGSDTERFLAWGLPIFLIIITKIIVETEFYKSKVFYFIIITMILTYRLFWISPYDINADVSIIPILTPLSNEFNFVDLFSMHGNKKYIAFALFQYLLLSLFSIYISKIWIKYKTKI
jgi:hypothetical protein